MKRIFLLIATNFAVLVVLSLAVSFLGFNQWLSSNGINYSGLLLFCAIFGFGGAFFSLLISKPMAKWSTGARSIQGTEGSDEAWLVATVQQLAERAQIAMPEVAIYDGAPNAFATGPTRNSALVAVSTGLLSTMDRAQVEAVLAHEIAHVANQDMVTLALMQGVVNTFVMFMARVVGYLIDRVVLKNEGNTPGVGYMVSVVVLDILFGFLAAMVVASFSRAREYRADAGAARLLGSPSGMISALNRLAQLQSGSGLPQQLNAFGISGNSRWLSLFASHPPLEKRIAALVSAQG
jgi:heat shock protein HtpX